ncbi:MAG: ATP-binding cassette domain-containing protein [Deltaproteobacteria bacterium]|nr:ATP-binding cassette domain-containing protein [Deltaproteobacteria bacterium]
MTRPPKIKIKNLSFAYGENIVLNDISAQFEEQKITAITGPSGNGKSTFLMVMNRLWEGILGARLEGRVSILIDNTYRDIYSGSIGLSDLRRKVGMVFQTPNPLPMSIVKNVSFPLKLMGCKDKKKIVEKTEQSLRQAYLWNEVKDRLDDDAGSLSGGQQQRLCIARALILEPEVILLDEPTSSLDKTASAVIEELLIQLKKRCTILMVSHYLDQVKRIADNVFEFSEGKFIRL